jgi:hypothetical protein
MNREKKEDLRKFNEKRKGKTIEEISEIERQEDIDDAIDFIARRLHGDLFDEEYDFTRDEITDVKTRAKGENPMSKEYIKKVAAKREALGVSPLSSSGDAVSGDSRKYCFDLIKAAFEEKAVREQWIKAKMAMDKALE